jgi:exopolysaccharide production protein ExoQ
MTELKNGKNLFNQIKPSKLLLTNISIFLILLFSTRIYLKFSNVTEIFNVILLLLYSCLIIASYKKIKLLVFKNHFFELAITFCAIISILWSEDKLITFKASFFLFLATFFFLACLYLNNIEKIYKLLSSFFIFVIITSCALYLTGFGEMTKTYSGAINGMFPHKNLFGRFCAIAFLFYLTSYLANRNHSAIFLMLSCLLFIFMSESKGALLILLISIFTCLFLLKVYTGKLLIRFIYSTLLFVSLLALYLASINIEVILAFIGKDITLTGRVQLWKLSLQYISESPFLGYGFDVFWKSVIDSNTLSKFDVFWEAPHSHNGFLDLLLDLGLLGLFLYLLLLINTIRICITNIKYLKINSFKNKQLLKVSYFSLLSLVYILLSSFIEKAYFGYNEILWFLFLIISYFIFQIRNLRHEKRCNL